MKTLKCFAWICITTTSGSLTPEPGAIDHATAQQGQMNPFIFQRNYALLIDAAAEGDATHVNYLLSQEQNVNQLVGGCTALMEGTRRGNVDVVRTLLRNDAKVDQTNGYGVTALMMAAEGGHVEIARMLMKNRANVNHVDDYGLSPLVLAASNGHVEVVQSLISHGANLEQPCRPPTLAAVHQAQLSGHRELARFLTEFGNTNMNLVRYFDFVGSTALMIAIRRGHLSVVRLLVETGKRMDSLNPSFVTGLIFAAERGQVDIARYLIEQGAPIDITNYRGDTPLLIAVGRNHIELVNLFLHQGASHDLRNSDGRTPLILAAEEGRIDIVRLFIEYEANLNQVGVEGITALLVASLEGFSEIVLLLLENGAAIHESNDLPSTELIEAARYGRTEIVGHLLRYGADMEMTDMDGRTALTAAAENDSLDVCRLLIQAGADIEYQGDEDTVLITALKNKSLSVVKLLIEHGVDVDHGNELLPEETPLYAALDRRSGEAVRLLILAGADTSDYQDAPLIQELIGPLHAVDDALATMESPIKAFVGLASSHILGLELLITFAYKARNVLDIFSHREIQAYMETAGWRHVAVESLSAIIDGLRSLECSDVHVLYIIGPFIARADSRSIERLLQAIRFLANDGASFNSSFFNEMIRIASTVGLGPVIDAIHAIMDKMAVHVSALSKVESQGGLKLQADMAVLIHGFLQGSVRDSLLRHALRELNKAIGNHYENLSKRRTKRSWEELIWMTTMPPKRNAGAPEDDSS